MTDALMVLDVQNDVVADAADRDTIVATIADLVDRARCHGTPVIWVRHHDEDLLQGGAGWHIVPELVPADGEVIIEKTYGDAFAETELLERMADLSATGIILTGAQTDFCVRSTLIGGLYRGIPMTLVADAHTTVDLRGFGFDYTPDEAKRLVNSFASHTVLPGVRSRLVTAAELFLS